MNRTPGQQAGLFETAKETDLASADLNAELRHVHRERVQQPELAGTSFSFKRAKTSRSVEKSSDMDEDMDLDSGTDTELQSTSFSRSSRSRAARFRRIYSLRKGPLTILDRLMNFLARLIKSLETRLLGSVNRLTPRRVVLARKKRKERGEESNTLRSKK